MTRCSDLPFPTTRREIASTDQGTNDADLIAWSQAGDVHAFSLLIERYQQRVYAMCFRMPETLPTRSFCRHFRRAGTTMAAPLSPGCCASPRIRRSTICTSAHGDHLRHLTELQAWTRHLSRSVTQAKVRTSAYYVPSLLAILSNSLTSYRRTSGWP